MSIGKKIEALEAIYEIQGSFFRNLDTACRKGCSHCCTAKVTMTTLEGGHIAHHLRSRGKEGLVDRVLRKCSASRFIPGTTTNRIAEICIRGGEPPAETLDGALGTCPLLGDDCCLLYPVRPLSCRIMVSRTDCAATGYADIDDFRITVSTVLMQYVEHLDADGCTGNLADVMRVFTSSANRAFYSEGSLACAENRLVRNRPIPALMIPPEHRKRIRPLLERIAGLSL